MTHKKKHQGSNSTLTKSNPDPTCMPKMKPFFENLPIYQNMAAKLQIDADFLMALSSKESGWLDPHNQKIAQPFWCDKGWWKQSRFRQLSKSG